MGKWGKSKTKSIQADFSIFMHILAYSDMSRQSGIFRHILSPMYSSLWNRYVAENKRGGGKDEPFLISMVPIISMVVGKMTHS